MDGAEHKTRTLWLVGVLHAFTHLYQVALIPLYLMIQRDLKLENLSAAPLLVTLMGIGNFLPAYPSGLLADRFSRRKILAIGLAVNAAGFLLIGIAPSYSMALLAAILSGLGGSLFHPAATALVARIYPVKTGWALGLIGIGASVGFFTGPIYAGWRATLSGNWRTPIIEMGVLGLVTAAAFWWLADEEVERPEARAISKTPLFPKGSIVLIFLVACLAFSMRDFAGGGMGTLSSLFLQKAWGMTPGQTGTALACIFLASAISNPLFGGLSDKARMRWVTVALVAAATVVICFPHAPVWAFKPLLLTYGFFFLASYPMVEAELMQAVPDAVRGRIFGLFITVGGLIGNTSHWVAGSWVSGMGDASPVTSSYDRYFAMLAGLIILSLIGLPFLKALRKQECGEVSR